jgi:hypothetical protein
MRRKFSKKGQSTAEYAIVIALVVGALIGMQKYVKRGLQGSIKDGLDRLVTDTDHEAKLGTEETDINYSFTLATDAQHGAKAVDKATPYLESRRVTSTVGDDTYETEELTAEKKTKRASKTIQTREVTEDYEY